MPNNPPAEADFARERDRAAREAAEWVIRFDRGLTLPEREAFGRWQSASALHAAEFERLQAGWKTMDRAGAVTSLAAMAEAVEVNARAGRVRRTAWSRWAIAGAAAAAVAVLLNLGRPRASFPAPPRAEATPAGHYLVQAATARNLALADLSVAQLNGDSEVVPAFVPAERRVTLVHGEAHFHVSKNPARPFIVSAGPITVHAVGTAFDVRLDGDSISVLVTEGKVSLGSASATPMGGILVAGDRAIVHLEGGEGTSVTVDRPPAVEAERALSWEATHLVFNRTPVSQVVEAFNRFNIQKMVLSDPALGARTLTGTFRADNLTGFVRLLGPSVDLMAEANGQGELVLRSAQGSRL